MADPAQVKAGLEKIVSDLGGLIRIAQEADQSLLAFMLDQARAEAESQLRKFKS